jgi:putative tryptophan/tyrosine transport system substrate-binding protein
MKRRQFIHGLACAAAAAPLGVYAQEQGRNRRVGVILPAAADNKEYQSWLGAFLQAMAQLDWNIGRNLRIDVHWATADAAKIKEQAKQLVALAPDVIVAAGTSTLGPVLEITRTIPVVFPSSVDPVGAGYVSSLARPGGNATGFLLYEYSLGGKWVELLKEIAPRITRIGVLRDPTTPSGSGQFAAIQAFSSSFAVDVIPLSVLSTSEIERDIAAFSENPNGALILTGSGPAVRYHDFIIKLVALKKVPTMYYERFYAEAGGLISYGPDRIDQYRRAAAYVDRILKGEKPADLPVQAPTKFETIINVKTAKALGLRSALGANRSWRQLGLTSESDPSGDIAG